ncbi:RF-PROK-I domain-containing protein [Favolaschia claudopus]|uniref:RF-PROK-I domain-containing protein n=1 Tax=Favolaschia claudopus TaxID=2862362 RepID=A0AAW0EF76_9AGAR
MLSLLRHVRTQHGSEFRRLPVFMIKNAHTSGGNKDIPAPPQLTTVESAQETALARTWISQFRALGGIPKSAVQLSFSRSSGPGGQNVNKVNTKVTLKCGIDENWIPLWAKPALKQSPHYVSSSQSIQITSTVHRSQSHNIEECLSKLHALLISASSSTLKNEPSEAQKQRVKDLVKTADTKRRVEKTHRSRIKADRKARPD